jgi:hypothetical protein
VTRGCINGDHFAVDASQLAVKFIDRFINYLTEIACSREPFLAIVVHGWELVFLV